MKLKKRLAVPMFALVVLSAGSFAQGSLAAGERVALVIGNSAYQSVSVLPNPRRDAAAIAGLLTGMGFEVTHAEDLDASGMRRTLRDFEEIASESEIALVYYAGHGIEVDGQNYLIPTDAELAKDTHVEDETVALSRVLAAVEGASTLRLVLLDACRNNPFLRTMQRSVAQRVIGRGLAPIEVEGSTLVSFAAEAGQTAADGAGEHSPYTLALLEHLPRPGLELNFVLRHVNAEVKAMTGNQQESVMYGSLGTEEIYLAPAQPDIADREMVTAEEMRIAYADAAERNTPEAFKAFLAAYDDPYYRSLAEFQLSKLEPPVADVATQLRAAYNEALAANTVEAFRALLELTDDPFYTSLVNYHIDQLQPPPEIRDAPALSEGDKVRAAYEHALQLASVEGFKAFLAEFDDPFYGSLARTQLGRIEEQQKAAALDSGSLEDVYWATIKDSKVVADLEAYLRRFPDGENADLARAKLEALQRAGEVVEGVGEGKRIESQAAFRQAAAANIDRIPVNLQQYGLIALGFVIDEVTGVMDSPTRKAIRGYQASIEESQTGRLTAQQTVDVLLAAAAEGDSFSQMTVGWMLQEGIAWEKNYALARAWFTRSAEQGNTYAMTNLAKLYLDGRIGTPDLERARTLLQQAADLGSEDARKSLMDLQAAS